MNIRNPRRYFTILAGALILFGLYMASLYSYLLFHSVAEIFSIIVAFSIFIVAWNSRRFLDNNYFIFIGIAYLFMGHMDLAHTLVYPGMGVFPEYGTNTAAQLWIGARYIESLSLLIAPLLIGRKLRPNFLFLGYGVAISFLLVSIFYWQNFPVCFIEGTGLTLFKKISEYIISLILLGSIFTTFQKRREFDIGVLRFLFAAIITTVVSELVFTLYETPFGLPNLTGHFLKIASFYFIYKAIIETGLVRPYDLLFRNLRQSEEQFRDLYEEAPNAYLSVGIDGRIERANRSAIELFGYGRNELVGRPVFDLYADTPNGKAKAQAMFQKSLAGKEIRNEELEVRRADGSSAWINLSVRPILDKDGQVIASRSEILDITERKKLDQLYDLLFRNLRQSEEQFRDLYEEAPNAYLSVGIDGRIERANRSAIELFGYGRDELVGRSVFDLYADTPDGKAKAQAIFQKFIAGEEIRNEELELRRADGSNAWINLSVRPIRDREGKVIASRSQIVDITERKKLDQLKDDFISLVSHELRSPMTVITGAVNTALTEAERLSPEETRQLLKDAALEADSLSRLLNNLLELSRVQANRLFLHAEPISVKKVIQDAISEIKRQSSTHQFVVDLPRRPPMVYADQLRLERILCNLIENAVKYSPQGGEIRVSARPREEHLVIGVSDQGIGISHSEQSQLFEPFQRLEESRPEGAGGVGLGLLVCRRLVEAHGGQIWVESEPGRGSTFYFTMPVSHSSPGEEHL